MITKEYRGSAVFSDDLLYRYSLERIWEIYPRKIVLFILLNPSTADEMKLDPTLKRCETFAREWGYSGMEIVNLFALRSTNPRALYRVQDPIGEFNPIVIESAINRSDLIVAAWGTIPSKTRFKLRHIEVIDQVTRIAHKDLYCLKITKGGDPSHVLYLPGDSSLILYKKRVDVNDPSKSNKHP